MGWIILLTGLAIAGWFFFTAETTPSDRQQIRTQWTGKARSSKIKLEQRLESGELAALLQRSGLKIRPLTYQYIRFIVVGLSVWETIVTYPHQHSLVILLRPVLVWVLFLYRGKYAPMRYLLSKFAFGRRGAVDREIALLYDLLYQEMRSYRHQSENIYHILTYITRSMKHIRRPLNRCLTTWTSPRGPKRALDQFAMEIGTDEAKELASILYNISQSEIETGIDSLERLQDKFREKRIAQFNERLKTRRIIAYVMGGVGILTCVFDIWQVAAMYAQDLFFMQGTLF